MLSAGNEIVVGSCRSASQYLSARASAATNLQQEGDKFSPFMDDASEPPSARIDAFGTDAPGHSAFFSGPIEQHLQGCAWFYEGAAQAVVAGAAACPEKARLLFSLMANVESAINSLNIGLEMCEDRRGDRVEEEAADVGDTLEKVRPATSDQVACVRAPMACNTLAVAPAPKQLSVLSVDVPIPVAGLHPGFRLGVTDPAWPTTRRSIHAPAVSTSATSKWGAVEVTEISSTTHPIQPTAVVRAPPRAAPVPSGSPIAVLPRRLVPNAGDLLLDGLLNVLSVKEWELALHMPPLKGIGQRSPRATANVVMQMAASYMFAPEVGANLPAQHAKVPQRDATQMEEGLAVHAPAVSVSTSATAKWAVEITESSSTTHPSLPPTVVCAPPRAARVPFGSPIAAPRRLVPDSGDLLLDRLVHVLSCVQEWVLALHMLTLNGIGRGSQGATANVGMQMAAPYMFAPEVSAQLPAQHAKAPQRDATQMEEGLAVDDLPWEFDSEVDWGVQGLPFFYSLAAVDWSVDGVPGFDIGAINWNGAGVPL